jgi:hypothetical protein
MWTKQRAIRLRRIREVFLEEVAFMVTHEYGDQLLLSVQRLEMSVAGYLWTSIDDQMEVRLLGQVWTGQALAEISLDISTGLSKPWEAQKCLSQSGMCIWEVCDLKHSCQSGNES